MKPIAIACVLAALSSPLLAQKVVRAGSVAEEKGPAEHFTGSVRVRILTTPLPPGQVGAALVTFEPGARSNWHLHSGGQTLYVTEGCGWTQSEGGPVIRICAGDTIQATPGVKHWHGATPTTTMTHLSISETWAGKTTTWLEPVTASQYRGPEG